MFIITVTATHLTKMVSVTTTSESVKIQQGQSILEMTVNHWKCFIDSIELLKTWLMMKKEDITFEISELHIVAQIYVDSPPADNTVRVYDKENEIYLIEDELDTLLNVDMSMFTNCEPCYWHKDHDYYECVDCYPPDKDVKKGVI